MKVDGWTSTALDDLGLDPYAFRAYHTIGRRAGSDGACWEAVERMAERCRMSERRMQIALRDLERRGLIERVERAGETSMYRRLTPDATPELDASPHLVHPRSGGTPPPHLVHPTPAPGAPKGLDLEGQPLKEEDQGNEHAMGGAKAVSAPPAEGAHTSSRDELDIDRDPPRPPPAPDEIDMDPRLHPEHALTDRMNGKGSAMQVERDARSFFTRLLGRNAKNTQVQPRMRAWYERHGPDLIERVWDEAQFAQEPQHVRKSPLYYLIDALDGQFTPRAAANRSRQPGAARHIPDGLVEGQLVLLPNGEQHVLQAVTDVWAYLEGVETAVRPSTLRPVQEVTS